MDIFLGGFRSRFGCCGDALRFPDDSDDCIFLYARRYEQSKGESKKAIFFSLSIIAIYTALGLIISMLLGPDFINWLSTNWVPNVFFFVIFMIFASFFLRCFRDCITFLDCK